jgi:secreted PhoX family phosphatase
MKKQAAADAIATRRKFLLGAGAASAATVGAVAAMAVAPAANLAQATDDLPQADAKPVGYQATAHVSHYYKTAAL